ncbi:MAG: hypothetical protein HY922_13425 [Elusimicrobia bacterium]|nr:hypothetical protein [Elusimicrobiota bacterium]
MNKKIKVLFFCIGNACRSQIAEGWARRLKGDVIEASSAGTAPGDKLNHYAVKLMADAGVDISRQFPKRIDSLRGKDRSPHQAQGRDPGLR